MYLFYNILHVTKNTPYILVSLGIPTGNLRTLLYNFKLRSDDKVNTLCLGTTKD